MDKVRLMFMVVLIALVMSSCTQRQITSKADELVAYSWESSDKFNKNISLSFNDNYAILHIKTNGFEGDIKGDAIITDNSIKIFDNQLSESFRFDYTLYGDKIELKYCENTIELRKITVQT